MHVPKCTCRKHVTIAPNGRPHDDAIIDYGIMSGSKCAVIWRRQAWYSRAFYERNAITFPQSAAPLEVAASFSLVVLFCPFFRDTLLLFHYFNLAYFSNSLDVFIRSICGLLRPLCLCYFFSNREHYITIIYL